ncbi:hypothetical protein [Streptomyces aureocirculatus]|uniref:hypothetical protein n=1 Tax=Streptomyces aureocirculatus TaxID=67275 RepID=UPI0004CBFF85|nr:hypothetical protein [Streptomyces aureocirculatus]
MNDSIDALLREAHQAVARLVGMYFDRVPLSEFAADPVSVREALAEHIHEGLSDEWDRLYRAVEGVEHCSAPSTPADRDLRDRIAQALSDSEGWKWAPGFKEQSPTWRRFQQQADAVLAVLPSPTDRAAVRDAEELAELDREGAELVCVDQCGNCDACGMESLSTPAEGWREAARFLRRTPRESDDFLGAVRSARLIEDELRRKADGSEGEPQP